MTGDGELIARVRGATPARVFRGGVAGGDLTQEYLRLRADHAAARDAIDARLELDGPSLAGVTEEFGLFLVDSRVGTPAEHLRRPDLGRRLSDVASARLTTDGTPGADVQVVIADGLSAAAVHGQVPVLLPALRAAADSRGWGFGRPFAVRHARVGVLNEVGDLLAPRIAILLIGERPGLTTADSLSAYLAYRPRSGQTDGDRNLVSNIHAGGTPPLDAASRIIALAAAMDAAGRGGPTVRAASRALPG